MRGARILKKTRPFRTAAHVESLSLPEDAWSAEYSIKHDHSAQEGDGESLSLPEDAWNAEYIGVR